MPHDFNNLTDTPLPDDVVSLVVENLHDDRALHACTLVNRAFHVQATKLLYRSLSSRIVQRSHGVCYPLLQVFHFDPLRFSPRSYTQQVSSLSVLGWLDTY
jgi:hypothetical protein